MQFNLNANDFMSLQIKLGRVFSMKRVMNFKTFKCPKFGKEIKSALIKGVCQKCDDKR